MKFDGKGYFRAKVSIADNTIPIANAIVTVKSADEENYGVEFSLRTDEDGITEIVQLPAPILDYSLTPDPTEAPFATYTVEVHANGFRSDSNIITIFDSTDAYQNFNLLPVDSTSEPK